MTPADFADRGETDPITSFTEDWQVCLRGDRNEPPPITEYIPDGTQARVAVLTDLVRIDLRHRWDRAGLGKRIAEYRKEFPEVEQSAELVELLCEEFLARRRYGPLELADFVAEYPELAPEVRARLAAYADQGDTERAAALVAGLLPGHRIDDFDLLTELGTGTLGRVFLARQRSMQRLVAVRLSAGHGTGGQSMAQLDHPHLVRVFDQRLITAALPATPQAPVSTRLVYMQYLPGGTAAGLLAQRRRGPESDGGALLLRALDAAMEARGEIRPSDSSVRAEIAALNWPETVAWIGRRLADALNYAEQQGVLHRDIKPANVLFTAEGIPKFADFAVRAADPRAGANPLAAVPDSLPYRSPEQLAELLDPAAPPPGPRSDIYSLGALLWELLTGAMPFDDPPLPADPDARPETIATMVDLRERGVGAAALQRLPADTPNALRRVLLECLRADPRQRWRNGAELAAQLDLCLDERARELVDPAPNSLARRARGWLIPILTLCVGVPNALASIYNINLNNSLIIDRMTPTDQERFAAGGLITNLIAFPVAGLLLLFLTRRPLTIGFRLARGREYSSRTLAAARRDTLQLGDWAVWVPFGFWLVAGVVWPLAPVLFGVELPRATFLHFFAAQVVCAAIALAYPFFPITIYAVRSIYPQLLVRGGIGAEDEAQLRKLAKRGNFYLGAAASVPLLSVASATFVDAADLGLVIVSVRVLSVGGILAFVLTYRLFRMLEADLLALARAIPQRNR